VMTESRRGVVMKATDTSVIAGSGEGVVTAGQTPVIIEEARKKFFNNTNDILSFSIQQWAASWMCNLYYVSLSNNSTIFIQPNPNLGLLPGIISATVVLNFVENAHVKRGFYELGEGSVIDIGGGALLRLLGGSLGIRNSRGSSMANLRISATVNVILTQ
jgi:hypothetical protein